MKSFTHIIYRSLSIVCLSAVCSLTFGQTNLVSLAQGALEQGDFQQAAKYLEQEINNNPANVEAYLLYDRLYNIVEMPAAAALVCSWGIGNVKKQDERDRLIEARATDLGTLGIYESALQEYKKLAASNPKNEEAHYGMAYAFIAMNDTTSALSVLYKAQKSCKESVKIQGLLVELLSSQSNKKETAKQLKRFESIFDKADIVDWSPDRVFQTSIMANLSLDRYDEMAKKIIDHQVEFGFSFSPKSLYNNNKAVEAVVKELNSRENVIRKNKNGDYTYGECLKYLANLYMLANNYPLAVKYFDESQNDYVDIFNRLLPLSKILIFGKCEDNVKKLFDQEEKRIGKISDLSERLNEQRTLKAAFAVIMSLNNKYQESITAYEESGEEKIKSNIAAIYYRQKDYEKVLEIIESQITEGQGSSHLLEKAYILSALGRTEEATDLYQTVIAVFDEDDFETTYALASLGDVEKARASIKNQIDSFPDSYLCYIMAAMTETACNDFPKAAEYLKKAINLDSFNSFLYITKSFLFTNAFLESNEYKEIQEIIDGYRNELNKQLILNT